MCRQFSRGMISVGSVVAGLVGCLCLSAVGGPTAPVANREAGPMPTVKANPAPVAKQPANPSPGSAAITQQSYTGTGGCIGCHRPQAQAWFTTKHSHEFSGLPVTYRNDPTCLKCHVTAFGNPASFVAGMPAPTAKGFAVVGCEVCHGPGALHKNAAERFANATAADEAKLEKETKATIRKTPPDSVCAACHKTQGHQRHPSYEGQTVVATAVACYSPWATGDWCFPPRGTNVKACAACHYRQYESWLTEKHSAMPADLPAKYASDRQCLKCHATRLGAAGGPAATGIPKPKAIGSTLAASRATAPAASTWGSTCSSSLARR